jgi:hypothetical protein
VSVDKIPPSARIGVEPAPLSRGRLFAALALALVVGVCTPTAREQQQASGARALLDGAGQSWVVWLGLAAAVRLALLASRAPATRSDLAVAGACLLLVLAPPHYLVAVAASGLALWFAATARGEPRLRSAAIVLGAVMVSIFWAPHALVALATPLEHVDAWMVGQIARTTVYGNVVQMHDGNTYLVASRCTSVHNASLAILLYVALTRSLRPQGGGSYWLMAAGVFVSAVLINVGRLALMAQSLSLFHYLHAGDGATIVGLAATATGLAWATFAVRREIFA